MRRFLYLFIGLFFIVSCSFAQKAKYHEQIIVKLAQHVRWSDLNSDYKFTIGIIGSSDDFRYFQSIDFTVDKISDGPVEIRYFECTDNIDQCDLIYISEDCSLNIKSIVNQTIDDPILIISGKEGYGAAGSVINFIDKQGKISFELNQSQAQERGLIISDTLKSLAILI